MHTLSLLYSLCLSLDNEQQVDDDEDDDDLGLDPEMAAELGLGDGFKNLMKDGLLGGSGLVLGGEVLGVVAERGACMSGCVLLYYLMANAQRSDGSNIVLKSDAACLAAIREDARSVDYDWLSIRSLRRVYGQRERAYHQRCTRE